MESYECGAGNTLPSQRRNRNTATAGVWPISVCLSGGESQGRTLLTTLIYGVYTNDDEGIGYG